MVYNVHTRKFLLFSREKEILYISGIKKGLQRLFTLAIEVTVSPSSYGAYQNKRLLKIVSFLTKQIGLLERAGGYFMFQTGSYLTFVAL